MTIQPGDFLSQVDSNNRQIGTQKQLYKIENGFILNLIFSLSVGIFFVNIAQAEPGRNWRFRFSFFFYLDALKLCSPRGDGALPALMTGRNCGKFMACPFSGK